MGLKGHLLQLRFAARYLRSAKSLSVINTTAMVSSVATGVAVAAMVILMSVYDGFDAIVKGLYATSEADLVVTPARGKTFDVGMVDWDELAATEGVAAYSSYLEESVMMEYHAREMFATLRGVDSSYTDVVPLDGEGMMWYGEWKLTHGDFRRMVAGRSVDQIFADGYSTKNASLHDGVTIHTLRKESISPLVPISAIKSRTIRHAGTLSEKATTLTDHLFTSLDWAEELLSSEGRRSAIVMRVEEGAKIGRVAKRVESVLGEEFVVKSRYEANEAVYKATKFEKWAIFFILLLVTIIASATIISSLVMLTTEKRNDIATLYSMGARHSFVAEVFRLAGLLIGLRGVVGGLVLGVVVAGAQQLWGIIKMPGSTFMIENYPVRVVFTDLLGIVVAVTAVIWIITNFTISRTIPKSDKPDEIRY